MRDRRKVVIIGGGFGGLSAAKQLKSDSVEVTLIDRRNYHLFQPLLYQVATGSLSPGEIAYPQRGVLNRQKNLRVWLGTVQDIDTDSKRLFLADGEILPYDSLIVAAGSETTYFGHNEWQERAPGLKSIEEATAIRHKILYAFEIAERISDPEPRRLTAASHWSQRLQIGPLRKRCEEKFSQPASAPIGSSEVREEQPRGSA